jgi:hypothetical protein
MGPKSSEQPASARHAVTIRMRVFIVFSVKNVSIEHNLVQLLHLGLYQSKDG